MKAKLLIQSSAVAVLTCIFTTAKLCGMVGAGNEMGTNGGGVGDLPILPTEIFYPDPVGEQWSLSISDLRIEGPLNADELIEANPIYQGLKSERYDLPYGATYKAADVPLIAGGIYEYSYPLHDPFVSSYGGEHIALIGFIDGLASAETGPIVEIIEDLTKKLSPEDNYIGARVRLLKVDVESYESLEDFNPIANSISNDVQTAPEETPEKERTVEIVFSPSDFFQNYSDRISFEISSLTPDTSPNKGSIDDTAFKDSGGVDPVRYISKFEAKNAYQWDDPALQLQEVSIRVLFDGNEVFDIVKPPYNLISVFSRFDYLWFRYPASSESERFSKTIDHVMWKYNLSFSFTPEYDGTMSSAGETRSNGIWWDGVYLGSAAMFSEQFAASVLVHENSHYEDGTDYVYLSSQGHDAYHAWVAGGRTGTLSSQDIDNIRAWIEGEKESILDQQDHPTYNYLSPGGVDSINDYWNDMISYENDVENHGYNL
jgi:hypothetical protein